MSLRAYYELSCDEDCSNAFAADFDVVGDPDLMQAAAEAAGWVTRFPHRKRGRRHRCPDCVIKANAMKEPDRLVAPMRLDELEQICRESREGSAA